MYAAHRSSPLLFTSLIAYSPSAGGTDRRGRRRMLVDWFYRFISLGWKEFVEHAVRMWLRGNAWSSSFPPGWSIRIGERALQVFLIRIVSCEQLNRHSLSLSLIVTSCDSSLWMTLFPVIGRSLVQNICLWSTALVFVFSHLVSAIYLPLLPWWYLSLSTCLPWLSFLAFPLLGKRPEDALDGWSLKWSSPSTQSSQIPRIVSTVVAENRSSLRFRWKECPSEVNALCVRCPSRHCSPGSTDFTDQIMSTREGKEKSLSPREPLFSPN